MRKREHHPVCEVTASFAQKSEGIRRHVLLRLNSIGRCSVIIVGAWTISVVAPLNTVAASEASTKPVVGENGVISVGQDVMVTLVDGGRTALKSDEMSLVLNLDALSQDLQDFIGGKSARVVARIDCRERQIATQSMVVFDQPHAAGSGRPKAVAPGFAKPPPGSYGADILETYCTKPTTVAEASHPAAGPGLTAPPMLNLALSAPPPPVAAAKPLAPVSKAQAISTQAISTQAASPQATLAPPKVSPPIVTAQAAPPRAPPVASDPPRREVKEPAKGRGFVVQLVSSPSSEGTGKILARLRSELPFWPSDRSGYVATAQVRGSDHFRGRLDGFETRAQAAEFCGKVQAAGKSCVVFREASARKVD